MSSTYKVPYTKVLAVNPHPNADRLELATVYGFQVVVQKDKYKVGDTVIYVPVDSVLPPQLEQKIFPPESKIKLSKSRIRQIRIRQFPSQGMLIDPKDVGDLLPYDTCHLELEDDLSKDLGITKYEPPEADYSPRDAISRNKPGKNSYFRTYNGITNIKWGDSIFQDKEVEVTEKIHGTHVRFGLAPFEKNTWWKKVKGFFGLIPKYEFVYGSNNVELTNKVRKNSFYGGDIYGDTIKKYDAHDKVKEGEFFHGEIYGQGVQKGYSYGTKELKLIIFDIRVVQEDGSQKWLDPEETERICKERGFDYVPVIYRGLYNKEEIQKYVSGPSILDPNEKIREGIVIKVAKGYDMESHKLSLKWINPDYLDLDNSDFH